MELQEAEKILVDEKEPITRRMDAAFCLKSINSDAAVQSLSKGFTSSSNLLTHEIAYVLGQMKRTSAIPILENVLKNTNYDNITRHEAAEALAAIGQEKSIETLKQFILDPSEEVKRTSELALHTLKSKSTSDWTRSSKFNSEDPAPPTAETDIKKLETIFLDQKLPLFDRYSALFRLREIGTEEAVLIMAKGFEDKEALFKHEVAYVMGQVMSKSALISLEKVLRDQNEHPMAAEAMGSISGEEAKKVLLEFTKDPSRIVAESCLVALDMAEFWTLQEKKVI